MFSPAVKELIFLITTASAEVVDRPEITPVERIEAGAFAYPEATFAPHHVFPDESTCIEFAVVLSGMFNEPTLTVPENVPVAPVISPRKFPLFASRLPCASICQP